MVPKVCFTSWWHCTGLYPPAEKLLLLLCKSGLWKSATKSAYSAAIQRVLWDSWEFSVRLQRSLLACHPTVGLVSNRVQHSGLWEPSLPPNAMFCVLTLRQNRFPLEDVWWDSSLDSERVTWTEIKLSQRRALAVPVFPSVFGLDGREWETIPSWILSVLWLKFSRLLENLQS